MKSAGKARNNGLYRHIRTSKEIIRNLLNDFIKNSRTIMRINPLTEVPFFSAKALSCSITSGEKKTFVLSLLALGRGVICRPPFCGGYITILS